MKTRLQLSPKTGIKVLNRQRLFIAGSGLALALLMGVGVFMYGNFGNNAESLAAIGANMGFENNLTEWTKISGTWTQSNADKRSGNNSALCSSTTTEAKLRNNSSTVVIPSSGTNYITIIAYVKASNNKGTARVGVYNSSTSTESLAASFSSISTSGYTQLVFHFLAQNGKTYVPVLSTKTTSSTSNVYFDDVMIYTSTLSSADLTDPNSPVSLSATTAGNNITLSWNNADDEQSGVDGVLILRAPGINVSDPGVLDQVTYNATTSSVGPTSAGSYTVVYNGPIATSTMDNPGANGSYTYLIYMRDKAFNYTTGPARLFVMNGNNLNATISSNTQLNGLYLPSGCTLTISSTTTILAQSTLNVYGTIINTGNLLNNQGGVVNMKDGSLYIYNRNGLTNDAPVLKANWQAGSTCKITGMTNTSPIGLDQTFYNFTWDCTSQTSYGILPNGFNVNGTLSFLNTRKNNSLNTCWLFGVSELKGDIICSATADFCAYYGSLAKINGSAPQTIAYNVWFQNVEYNNPAGITFTSTIWTDSITEFKSGIVSMAAGRKFMTESGATLIYNGGSLSSSSYVEPWPYEASPTYDLIYKKGCTTGGELSSSTSYLGSLQIDCPGENVVLDKNAQVNISLLLSNGKLITNDKLLWVKQTAVNSVVSNNPASYIQGTLRRNISGSGTLTYDFPIGTANSRQMVSIKSYSLTGVDYLTSSFSSIFTGAAPNPNNCKINNTPITTLLNNGFWTVEPNSQPTSGNYEITVNAGGFTNPAASVLYYGIIKRSNSSGNWGSYGTHTNSTQQLLNGVAIVKRSGLTSFSDFAVGYGGGVLPITLSDFKADKYENDKVMIRWMTSAELNNAYFSLERSSNGVDFEMINEQEGAGTSTTAHHYEYLDANPIMGINYYRLKQVDFDGQFTYGPIKQVTLGQRSTEINGTNDFTIFPNPNNGQFNIGGIKVTGSVEKVKVIVMDIKGSIVSQREFNDGEPIKMDISDRPPGTYMVQVTDTESRINTKQIIVNR